MRRRSALRVVATGDAGDADGPSGPRYFGEVLRRRSSLADVPNLARRRVGRRAASPRSEQAVDLGRQPEVGVGEPALGVRRERQADLVPAVEEDVGVVVGGLGELGDAVDERDRGGEVREAEVPDDRLLLGRQSATAARRSWISASASGAMTARLPRGAGASYSLASLRAHCPSAPGAYSRWRCAS